MTSIAWGGDGGFGGGGFPTFGGGGVPNAPWPGQPGYPTIPVPGLPGIEIGLPPINIPGIGALGPCPPGTACSGPMVSTPLGTICTLGCKPIGSGEPPTTPTFPGGSCPPGYFFDIVSGQCQAYSIAPGNGGGGGGGGGGTPVTQTNGRCTSGWHTNRSSYFLKSGQHVPEGSRCVRNRSLNPGNGRAARRAISRLNAHVRHMKRIDKLVRKLSPTRSSKRPGGSPRTGGAAACACR